MSDETPENGWVVVAWTPDEFGAVALDHGLAEARLRSRGVAVVNASRGDALVDDRYAGSQALQDLEARLSDSGLPHTVRQSVGNDVSEQVLSVVDELGGRLVVLGLRRRSPVGKLLMGSVAQRVLLAAGCPVLAVKPGDAPDP